MRIISFMLTEKNAVTLNNIWTRSTIRPFEETYEGKNLQLKKRRNILITFIGHYYCHMGTHSIKHKNWAT